MDGGIYPWRRQSLDTKIYVSYEDLCKPLPAPPAGLMWIRQRLEDPDPEGCATRWELVPKLAEDHDARCTSEMQEDKAAAEDGLPEYLEHTVMPTDTMAGLRLRYRILRIPVEGREDHIVKYRQKPSHSVIRQRFQNTTSCTDFQMQTYYLESNDYSLDKSIAEFEDDKKWEELHAAKQVVETHTASIYPPDPSPPSTPMRAVKKPDHRAKIPPPSYRSFLQFRSASRLSSHRDKATKSYQLDDFTSSEEPSSDFVLLAAEEDCGRKPLARARPEERVPLLSSR